MAERADRGTGKEAKTHRADKGRPDPPSQGWEGGQKQKQTQKARALRRRRTCPARRRCAWASARACERTCARRRLLTATVAPACVAVRSNAVSDGEQHEGADERREEETKEKRQQPFDAVAKKEPERAEQNEAKSKFPASASLGLLRVPEGHAPPRNRYIAIAITGILWLFSLVRLTD